MGISIRNTYHGDSQSSRSDAVDHFIDLISVDTKAIECTRRGKLDVCLGRKIGGMASILAVSMCI